MKITRIKPPNHNYSYGSYSFRVDGRIKGVGFRVPLTNIDFRMCWEITNQPLEPTQKAERLS